MSNERQSYWELLKHPKWQEKRLRIMERAKFECEDCGDKTTTLNVHHSYYEKGLKPWEYHDDSLHCLCEPCHLKAGEWRKAMDRQIGRLSAIGNHLLEELLGFAYALEFEQGQGDFACKAEGHEMLEGMMRVWVTLSHRELDRYVDALIPLIGKDQLVHGVMLWQAVDTVMEADAKAGRRSAQMTYPPEEPT